MWILIFSIFSSGQLRNFFKANNLARAFLYGT